MYEYKILNEWTKNLSVQHFNCDYDRIKPVKLKNGIRQYNIFMNYPVQYKKLTNLFRQTIVGHLYFFMKDRPVLLNRTFINATSIMM